MNQPDLTSVLQADEALLWEGAPKTKGLNRTDIMQIVVIPLMLVGLFIYWSTIGKQQASASLPLLILFSSLFILYRILQAVSKLINNKRTYYALTDKRIYLFLRRPDGTFKRSAPLEILNFPFSQIYKDKDGTGTILFSKTRRLDERSLQLQTNWALFLSSFLPVFFSIENPDMVYRLYKDALTALLPEEQREESTDPVRGFSKYDM